MKRFFSDKDLEEMTGIKVKTFRNWRLAGAGPRYRKLGRTAKYEITDVEAWIRSCPAGGGHRTQHAAIESGERGR